MRQGIMSKVVFAASLLLAATAGFMAVTWMLNRPVGQLLSRNKPAVQSSIYDSGITADRGTDGDRKTFFHTAQQDKPYWQVDLGAVYNVSSVVLYNRAVEPSRAYGCQILVSDDGKAWSQVYDNAGRPFGDGSVVKPLEVSISARARFVRVQLVGNGFLHLGEVDVYGW